MALYQRSFLFFFTLVLAFITIDPRWCHSFGGGRVWPSKTFQDVQDQIGASSNAKLFHCRRPDLAGAVYPWSQAGVFQPECAPDTLYFWRPLAWSEALLNRHRLGENLLSWPRPSDGGFMNRFLWSTPLGTFGYGDSLVRVKLRVGVHFRAIEKNQRDCSRFTNEENDNTVYVPLHRPSTGQAYLTEYFICSEAVIQSWSVDAPQAWEEALRELAWIIRKPFDRWSAYIPNGNLRLLPLAESWFSLEESNEPWGGHRDSSLSLFPFVADRNRSLWSYESFLVKYHRAKLRLGDLRFRFRPVRSKWNERPSWPDHFHAADSYFHQRSIEYGDLQLLQGEEPPPQWRESTRDRVISTRFQ